MWDTTNNQDTIQFGLDEFADLIEKGGANLTERAVFITKLHRGLDASTLAENFYDLPLHQNAPPFDPMLDY